MKAIDQKKLASSLFAVAQSTIVSFCAVTPGRLEQPGNPHPDAKKVTIGTGIICWTYSKAVNRQRDREWKNANANEVEAAAEARRKPKLVQKQFAFKALHRSWGQRIKGTPLVAYVDADGTTLLYLEIKCQRRTFHWFDPHTCKRIDVDKIAKFIPAAAENSRQQVSNKVVLRDYRLDHIAEIAFGGTRYTIAPAAAELLTYFPAPHPTRAKAPAKAPARRTPLKSKRNAPGAK